MAMAADQACPTDTIEAGEPIGSPITGAQRQAMVDQLAKDAAPDIVAFRRRARIAQVNAAAFA
jgi:hypothetical protein